MASGLRVRPVQWRRCLCSRQVAASAQDKQVQKLLSRMTGLDLDKVFAPRKEPLVLPRYRLMNKAQLEKAHTETLQRARELLRMPPILPPREPKEEVLEENSRLAGLLDYKIVFTDVTQHKEHKSRRIVVREPGGHLREATWEERDRMQQVYFPQLGRQMQLPAVLQAANLAAALQRRDCHVDILEMVCAQCEPDSEDYIRVHKTVHADVDSRGVYDLLRSTRHFGGLVWQLMTEDKIGGLLKDMLTWKKLSDAEDLVRLHLLCYPTSPAAQAMEADGVHLVQDFCTHMGLHQLLPLCPARSEPDTTAGASNSSR